MSARGFGSVFAVGGIAVAALGCYLVSLRVASERAALESVENKIVLAQRDIRTLSTEIGTRGRLSQLERWNVKVIRLSAPTADQFVESSFHLATLVRPEAKPAIEAPVVLASAPAPRRDGPLVTSDSGVQEAAPRASRPLSEMMHIASYSKPEPKPSRMAPTPYAPITPKAAAKPNAEPKPDTVKSDTAKSGAVKSGAVKTGAVKTGAVKTGAVKTGAVKSGAVKATIGNTARSSNADPLSPLPTNKAPATKSAATKMASTKSGAKSNASSDSGSGARTTIGSAREPGSRQ